VPLKLCSYEIHIIARDERTSCLQFELWTSKRSIYGLQAYTYETVPLWLKWLPRNLTLQHLSKIYSANSILTYGGQFVLPLYWKFQAWMLKIFIFYTVLLNLILGLNKKNLAHEDTFGPHRSLHLRTKINCYVYLPQNLLVWETVWSTSINLMSKTFCLS